MYILFVTATRIGDAVLSTGLLSHLIGRYPPAPRLWTASRHDAAAETLVPPGGPVLAIGPAANWRGKQWRAERFGELAQRLTAPDGPLSAARVAVFAAAHERSQAEPLLAAI